MKKASVSMGIVLLLILMSIHTTTQVHANKTVNIFDPVTDVYVTPDISSENRTFYETENPDIDIVNVEYQRMSKSRDITIILELNQNGSIINQDDIGDMYNPETEGRTVFYYIQFATNEKLYPIIYINNTCTLMDEDVECSAQGNLLMVNFQVDSIFEQYDYLLAAGYDVINNSTTGHLVFIDLVPNESGLTVEIDEQNQSQDFYTGEQIEFVGNVFDLFGVAQQPFYYRWDFGNGSVVEEENATSLTFSATHVFEEPGIYKIKLYFSDAVGHVGSDELLIDVNDRLPEISLFNVSWNRRVDSFRVCTYEFVSKKETLTMPMGVTTDGIDVLTRVKFLLEWSDNNTYGMFGEPKGMDTMSASICQIGQTEEWSNNTSTGGGSIEYRFDISDRPRAFTMVGNSVEDVEQVLRPLVMGKNFALFEMVASVEIGEQIWRVIKYMQDKGDDFNLTATYEYYEYSINPVEW